jgi:hypothetical protein
MPKPVKGRRRPSVNARPATARSHSAAAPTDEARARLPQLLSLAPHDDVLATLDELAPATPGGAPALVEALGSSRDAAAGHVLTAIATAAPDRELRKSARRALHRLRSAGIDVAVPVAAEVETTGRATSDVFSVSRSLVTAIDGVGSRMVWLALDRPRGGGIVMMNLVLNDQTGLKDVIIVDTTMRRFGIEVQEWSARSGLEPVEVPSDYVLSLLSEALALNAEDGGAPLPRDFVIRRGLLGDLPPPPTDALIHQHVSRGQALLLPNLLDGSARLMEERELQGWLFGYEEVKEYVREWRQGEESRLILTSEPREAREQRIVATATDTLFTPQLRRAFRRRLEETAYVFWVSNRERAAREAVAAAFAIHDTGTLRNHPLLTAIARQSIMLAVDLERSGVPISPEFSRTARDRI